MTRFLGWVVQTEIVSPQQVVSVLLTKVKGQKADSSASIFAVRDLSLFCGAKTEQTQQALRGTTALRTYAASDWRLRERFLTLFGQKTVSPTFLSGSAFPRAF